MVIGLEFGYRIGIFQDSPFKIQSVRGSILVYIASLMIPCWSSIIPANKESPDSFCYGMTFRLLSVFHDMGLNSLQLKVRSDGVVERSYSIPC